MANFTINEKTLTDVLLNKQKRKYSEAGKKAIKEIRKNIVDEWFGEFSPVSMNGAFQGINSSSVIRNKTMTITIRHWASPEYYNPNQTIQDWNRRNNYGRSQIELMEYVMKLQLNDGIIGLPQHSGENRPGYSGRGWSNGTNLNFHQKTPLLNVLYSSPLWNNFYSYVQKYL